MRRDDTLRVSVDDLPPGGDRFLDVTGVARSNEVILAFRANLNDFRALVSARDYRRAAAVQLDALRLVQGSPEIKWTSVFRTHRLAVVFFFGDHGTDVAATNFSAERSKLFAGANQLLPADVPRVDLDLLRDRATTIAGVRDLLRVHLPISVGALSQVLRAEGYGRQSWFLDRLERNNEIETVRETVKFVKPQEGLIRSVDAAVPAIGRSLSRVSEMTEAQRRFYEEVFKPSFLIGSPVNLQGHHAYASILLRDLIRSRRKNADVLPVALSLAETLGHGSALERHANQWLADLEFVERRWERGFEIKARVGLSLDDVLARTMVLPERRLTVAELARISGSTHRLGVFAEQSPELVASSLQTALDAFHQSRGLSFLGEFWLRIVGHIEEKRPLLWTEGEGAPFVDRDSATIRLRGAKRLWKRADDPVMYAFHGVSSRAIAWPHQLPDPQASTAFEVILARIRAEFRRAENKARSDSGLPRVGEGWVSELALLRLVADAFPDFEVRHQGRPGWLGAQSLDIYLPQVNVGIEYQGIQHIQPVALFGGEAAYRDQTERDMRKKSLCAENDCILIEVHPGYEFREVESKIRSAIRSRTLA